MKKPIKSRFKTEAGYKRALKKYNDFVKANKTTKKQPAKKQPAKKQPAKRKPFDPPKRGRGRPRKQQPTTEKAPKSNKNLKIVQEGTKKLKDTGKQIYDAGKKGVGKLQTKLAAKDQTPQQPIPEGKSKGAKFAKKVNQKIGNYAKRVYNKAALDTFKFKEVMKDPSKRNINRSGVKRGIGAGAALTIGNALVNRLTKPKGMSHKEWKDFKAKKEQEGVERRRKLIKKGYDFYGKRLKKVSSDLTGKKYESSTSKNIKKQKKANNNSNKLRIKGKKTERSSRTNNNVNYNAKTRTRKVVTNEKGKQAMSSFRVDPEKNLQLQKEAKKGNKRTYTTVNAKNRKNLTNQHKKDDKKSGSSGKKMHAIEKRNRKIFGDAHVDRLKRQHEAFKRRRKKK